MTNYAWMYPFYRLTWTALDWVFPPVCGGCGESGSRWCKDCQQRVPLLAGKVCEACGLPSEESPLCRTCKLDRPSYHALRSWAVFDDPVQQALHRLKYRRDMGLGDALAAQMREFLAGLRWPIDFIVPIPLGRSRRSERGYNQVSLIALPLAMSLNLAYVPKALYRWRETRSQVGLSREQRRKNIQGAFRADERKVRGRTVLLMDDVATTGSTLSSGAEALFSAGARQVYALTVARALPRHGLSRA